MPSTKRLCERAGLSTCIVVLLMIVPGAPAAAAEGDVPGCKPVIGRVVSRQGTVEIRRTGDSVWHRVERLDTQVCDGDAVRTGPRSRAALWLQPENLIRLDQRTAVTIAANQAETKVEFFTSGQVSADPDCGAAYFISRFPRNFGVKTPFLSAAIKGTEFLVAAQCSSTTVAVFEGIVEAQELLSGRKFLVESLHQISVGPGLPSTIAVPIKPRDGVEWTIYYPRTAAWSGDEPGGATERCGEEVGEEDCEIRSVEVLLEVGAIKEAQLAIGKMRAEGKGGSNRLALEAVILVALDEKERALKVAQVSVSRDPESIRGWTALSYAKQANLDLEGALDAAKTSALLDQNRALLKARVAELLLTLGRPSEALRVAEEAVGLDAREPRAKVMRGLARLVSLKTSEAEDDFREALELEGTEPQARLGLGLAKIRQGRLVAGREELEIAVGLDPTNSLFRTYLAKAYFEENSQERADLAQIQFDLARSLDREDPTPLQFSAALKRSKNRPLAAINALRSSLHLNEKRGVYRASSVTDQDAAVRGADLAGVYQDLGLDRLANLEAAKAVSLDPSNFAAHRFLSNAYARTERREISRVSELLQSQLLQPIGASPVAPSQAFVDLRLVPGSEGFRPGVNEYAAMFERSRATLRLAGLAGNLDTLSDEAVVGYVGERATASFGQYYYSTDGFRPNNDVTHRLYNLFGQFAASPDLALQAEYRKRTSSNGDIALSGNPQDYLPDLRQSATEEIARVGLRYSPSGTADVLLSLVHAKNVGRDFRSNPFFGGTISTTAVESGDQIEVQGIRRFSRASIVGGASWYETHLDSSQTFDPGPCPFSNCADRFLNNRSNAYLLGTINLSQAIRVIGGASYDNLRDVNLRVEKLNPKFGLLVQPADWVAIRAATFQTVKSALIGNQTIEPAQVLGFAQYYDDVLGAVSKSEVLAIDLMPTRAYAGAEFLRRRLDDPSLTFGTPYISHPSEERISLSARYMIPMDVVVGVDYIQEIFDRPMADAQAFFLPSKIRNQFAPVSVRWFGPKGFSAGGAVTQVRQEISSDFLAPDQQVDTFTLVDLNISYRLPGRRGFVAVDIRNLFDRSFNFQDLNFLSGVPLTPRFLPTRTAFARVVLEF